MKLFLKLCILTLLLSAPCSAALAQNATNFNAITVIDFNALPVTDANKMLFDAIGDWNIEGMKNAFKRGADPNSRSHINGKSVINVIIGGLIPKHIRYKTNQSKENNAKFAKYEEKAISMLKIAFDNGSKIECSDQAEIMQCAVYSGSVKVTRYMVKKGVNPNVKNGEGRTALQLAIKNGSEAMVALLKECRTQVLADAEITQENLINACAKGDLVVAKKCLAQGARVNETDGAGRTALTAAVGMKRNYNMVKFLLAVGANPNLKSEAGLASTPLNTAIGPSENPGVKPIVILLLKAGAQISAPDDTYGMTPLHFAALFQNVAVAKILLEAGANVTLKDKKGKTPLDYAESSEMIKLLTASGAKE